MDDSGETFLTLGDVAAIIGAETWKLQKLYSRGILPEPKHRLGRFRLLRHRDVEPIRRAAQAANYLGPRRGPAAMAAMSM